MKKLILTLSLLIFSFGALLANEPINLEDQKINQEFSQLSKIETFVQNNEGTTLQDLKAENSALLENANLSESSSASLIAGDLPGNIPAFWWGCVLSWVGLLVVYLVTDKDQAQTKKALIGCLVGGVAYLLIYLIAFGSIFAAASRGI